MFRECFGRAARRQTRSVRLAWGFAPAFGIPWDMRLSSLAALLSVLAALLACKKEDKPAPVVTASVSAPPAAAGLCPSGKSEDPKFGEFKPAQTAFKERDYETAASLLKNMASKYPKSASIRVWQGDAALFDKKKSATKAADAALPFYEEAEKMHDDGCVLPIYERYYLRLGFALAYLRKKDGDNAVKHLKIAEEEFKNSANLYYNLARAYCRADDLENCVKYFEETLKTAKALKRPKFVRSHYSLSHWITRSARQSEFIKLRRDKRYGELVRKYKE